MSNVVDIFEALYQEAEKAYRSNQSFIQDEQIKSQILAVVVNNKNKAPIRFLMSCIAGKLHRPNVDIRKPYTKIGADSFSGRFYDENDVQEIISRHQLPCNATTAYLTPAFRNRDAVMTRDLDLVGRPPEIYQYALNILNHMYEGTISPEDTLKEMFLHLITVKERSERRIRELIEDLGNPDDDKPLSSEQIVTLIIQHLSSKNASRLPTLIVAAAYMAVGEQIGEQVKPLLAHNAADKQTGAFGDVEVTLTNEEHIVTCYEMKDKRVTKGDIDIALKKIAATKIKVDNYIFITTDEIEAKISDYARSLYDTTGVEFAILDCIGFLRHFLHFFHRKRTFFLEKYQELVLHEPNSSVGQPLKEAFLALRRAAEAGS